MRGFCGISADFTREAGGVGGQIAEGDSGSIVGKRNVLSWGRKAFEGIGEGEFAVCREP